MAPYSTVSGYQEYGDARNGGGDAGRVRVCLDWPGAQSPAGGLAVSEEGGSNRVRGVIDVGAGPSAGRLCRGLRCRFREVGRLRGDVRRVGSFSDTTSWSLPSVVTAGAVATVSWNGVRPFAHATISDVLMSLAGILVVIGIIEGDWPVVPAWLGYGFLLLAAGGLLGAAAIPTAPQSTYTFPLGVSKPLTAGSDPFPADMAKLGALLIAMVAVPVIVSRCGNVRLVTMAWVVGTSVNAAAALADAFFGTGLNLWFTGVEFLGRENGLSTHPNHLGLVAAMTFPVAVALALQQRWWWVPAVLLAGGVAVSASRGAALIFPIALVALAVTNRNLRQRLIGASAIAVPIAVLSFLLVGNWPERYLAAAQRAGSSTSNLERSLGLHQAWNEYLAHPWTGVGMVVLDRAENLYLEVLQGGGPVALVGLLVVFLGGAYAAWQQREHPIGAGLFASVIVLLSSAMVQNQATNRHLYVSFGLVIGLSAVRVGEARRHSAGRTRHAKVRSDDFRPDGLPT